MRETKSMSALHSLFTTRNSFSFLFRGNTPLHVCVGGQGHLNVAKFLLESKADVGARNKECVCPSFVYTTRNSFSLSSANKLSYTCVLGMCTIMSPNCCLSLKLTSKQETKSAAALHSCFTTRNSFSFSSAKAPPYTSLLVKGTLILPNFSLSLKLTSLQKTGAVIPIAVRA